MAEIMISQRHGVAVVPWQTDLAALPHAKRVDYQGQPRLVFPFDVEHARVLRNVGLQIPSPILHNYDWNGSKPWDVQKDTAALLTVSSRAYCFNEMRTGKTRSVLWALDYLKKNSQVRKALVVAPLSTLNIVWRREILLNFPHLTCAVLHGSKAKRLERLGADVDIYIINHDGPETIEQALLARDDIDVVVFDEVAVYRESRTKRWGCAQRLTKGRKYVWGLTGKPTPNAPSDAYGIGRLITPTRLPRYFREFRDTTMMKVSQFRWVPRAGATDYVFNVLKPSVRFRRNDIASAPPTAYLDRECELSPLAAKMMKDMVNKLRIMLAQGGSITAMNAGVQVNKLLQIAAGWVYKDDGSVLDVSSPTRLRAIDEILQETDRQVLVFVPYVNAISGVAQHLAKTGYRVCTVSGATPAGERDRIFGDFQSTDKYDVMVAHPQCMAHGLRLTSADTVVWYGCPPSNEIYAQANDRIMMPDLAYQTAIIHLIGSPIERRRYASLRKQETLQETLLGMLQGVQEGI